MTPNTRLRPLGALLCTLPLLLTACGGGSADPKQATDAGYAALNSGDSGAAVDHFAAALEVLAPGDAGYKRARMGEIEAKVKVAPDAATASFIDYAGKHPDQVSADDYQKVGIKLSENKALGDAVKVLDAGLKRFADNPKLKQAMDLTVAKAETSNDSSALDLLKGLGYVGGD